jgi:hypothetical protein
MPQPNLINKNLFSSKLEGARYDEESIKVMREAIIKQERDMEIIKEYMSNNALKGQAALDLAAQIKIELREV